MRQINPRAAEFIDAPGIAAMLSIDRRTLRRLIVVGKFPKADLQLSKTLLRWKRVTVDRWIEDQSAKAGAR